MVTTVNPMCFPTPALGLSSQAGGNAAIAHLANSFGEQTESLTGLSNDPPPTPHIEHFLPLYLEEVPLCQLVSPQKVVVAPHAEPRHGPLRPRLNQLVRCVEQLALHLQLNLPPCVDEADNYGLYIVPGTCGIAKYFERASISRP